MMMEQREMDRDERRRPFEDGRMPGGEGNKIC